LVVDLTHEFGTVGVGSDRRLDLSHDLDLEFGVEAYYGSEPVSITASNVNVSIPSAFSASITKAVSSNPVTVTLTIKAGAGTLNFSSIESIEIPITVTTSYGERTLTYTIVPIESGADGKVYILSPSTHVVVGTYSGNTIQYSPSQVSCRRMIGNGSTFTVSTNGQLSYNFDGSSTRTSCPNDYAINVSDAISNNSRKIFFYWEIDGTVIISAEVPIIKDGQDGDNASAPVLEGPVMRVRE
jgi:hypothetical protein